MENNKNIGIWMDHAAANFIDINALENNHSIVSKFTYETMDEAIHKSENLMHNKRQQMQEAYYKDISEEVLKYNQVLLFGPTDAKTELYNYLQLDLHFKDIKFDIEPADKMTDNEKNAFVKKHFETMEA